MKIKQLREALKKVGFEERVVTHFLICRACGGGNIHSTDCYIGKALEIPCPPHSWMTGIDPDTVEWLKSEEPGTIASETFELKYIICSSCGKSASE